MSPNIAPSEEEGSRESSECSSSKESLSSDHREEEVSEQEGGNSISQTSQLVILNEFIILSKLVLGLGGDEGVIDELVNELQKL